jgi:Family of unknown function (DUF5329)
METFYGVRGSGRIHGLNETLGTLAALEITIAIQSIFRVPKRPTSMDLFRLLRNYFGILAIVALVLFESHVTNAASAPADETQKIEAMIQDVRDLKDATFIRNGSSYNSKNAAIFLRRKWQANHSEVKTARDFINKVATFSGTSGKPYLIRFKDGVEVHSRDFLMARLKRLEG